MSDFLLIANTTELLRIPMESLVCVVAEGNYTDLFTRDGERHRITLQIGVVRKKIAEQLQDDKIEFGDIGRSLTVNLNYVFSIHPTKKEIILSDGHTFKITKGASPGALHDLKEFFEKEKEK